ncbi:TetR/AcrR family transcriptional regulator [Paractinoplanes atraurantiacus]|uniref:DNA-binding transcriptional regulator, AcrR family n=1 Tax=Paractinoplanes atraurantiacus TaxID=1036182 RepID=A0A285HX39_9ACTN|nr:TetR/AcrR family transcriptional regulator [Actinoplanes atraurantiacus]SNY40298.1 DNA-binding transcriptional regulator, AcrR family [Actinoplanes atraurantiacus]
MSDHTRAQLVDVAAKLLADGGPGAVTTRSVAQAAGVQVPTIYRLFGDKMGLLDAVVTQGFTSYVAQKHMDPTSDPAEALREGFHLHISFGLDNPQLYRLMYATLLTAPVVADGARILQERIHRVAAAGRLRVSERRACDLIRATATGVVFTMIDTPDPDDTLPAAAWSSLSATILEEHPEPSATPTTAAVALRAALPELPHFSPAESHMLDEWLARLTR